MSASLAADAAGVAVGEVDAADWQADVVDDRVEVRRRNDVVADRLLDPAAQGGDVLDPHAGLRAHVQLDLVAVHRGEEVLPEERHQPEGEQHGREEPRDHAGPVRQSQFQQAHVAAAHALEPALEPLLETSEETRAHGGSGVVYVLLQQKVGQRRHQRAREDVGADHREHHRLGKRAEQEAGHPAQAEHRHEHDADAQQRDGGRHHDLPRAVQDRRSTSLPLSRW